MRRAGELTDEELLASGTPEAMGLFYDRTVEGLLGYFARRTRNPEVAADLTAETYAAAIVARARFRGDGTPATAWLFAIAHRKLADYQRRGFAEDRLCRRLALERPVLSTDDAHMIDLLADDTTTQLLEALPPEQSAAVRAHVVDGRSYGELAAGRHVSEAVVRKRVSRGLHALRRRLEHKA
ncbi:MAG TPA: RNA polymerase sigma factor [Solirubrobacteraceae bacterium]|jgi:RNA polymerase sigma-70 factor (ECF subfamily)